MIIIVKNPGSQVGSPAAVDEGVEGRGGGRGKGGADRERKNDQSRRWSCGAKSEIKVENRQGHERSAEDFSKNVREIASLCLRVFAMPVFLAYKGRRWNSVAERHCTGDSAHALTRTPGRVGDSSGFILRVTRP